MGGPFVAASLGPDAFPLGLGLLFGLEEGGAVGLFQILSIRLGHAGADQLQVYIPLIQPDDGDHPSIAVDVTDFAPDQVRPGMWAEIYGDQQRVEHLAAAAGLASNALLVPTARQARRCYTGAPGELHGEAY